MTKCHCGAEYQNGSGRKKRCDDCTAAYLKQYHAEYRATPRMKQWYKDYTIRRILEEK